MSGPSPFHSEVVSNWLDAQNLPAAIRRMAEALLLGYPLYAANVALASKPDAGWRALQQLTKSGAQTRYFANRNRTTCAVLDLYQIAYNTSDARRQIIAAWAMVEPRIRAARQAGWLVLAEYLAVTLDQRPTVTYNDQAVETIYPDPAYAAAAQRYVIKLGSHGAGSKRPQTLLRKV